jgi:hypothetical protein
MKRLFDVFPMVLLTMVLGGCAASSTSPIGVNCDYRQEKPMMDMPVDCQGR